MDISRGLDRYDKGCRGVERRTRERRNGREYRKETRGVRSSQDM